MDRGDEGRKDIGHDSSRDSNRFDVIMRDIDMSLNDVVWCGVV